MTITSWEAGKPLTWDVTCVYTMAISNIVASSFEAGGDANRVEELKIAKYCSQLPNYNFLPLGFKTVGSWGKEATKMLKTIVSKQFGSLGNPGESSFCANLSLWKYKEVMLSVSLGLFAITVFLFNNFLLYRADDGVSCCLQIFSKENKNRRRYCFTWCPRARI